MFHRPDYQNVGRKIQTVPNSRGKSIVVENMPWLEKDVEEVNAKEDDVKEINKE